jgi:cell division transport system permease protein
MRILIYSILSALKNLWHEKWINLLTVLSISIGLLILTTFAAISINMDSMLKRWSRSFGIVVYLDDNLTEKARYRLKNFFQKDPDIINIKYISEDEALREVEKVLGSKSTILEGFSKNPLPSSFELGLRNELLESSLVKKKAAQIMTMAGVDEVVFGEKWLSSLNRISEIIKIALILLGTIVLVAIIFVTYSTIKIFFYRRKDEIETLKLLGATRNFIRLPFLIEGLCIGVLGGLISAFSLYSLYSLITVKVPLYLPSIKSAMVALPVTVYLSVPPAAAVMSFIGSFIAVGKIRY